MEISPSYLSYWRIHRRNAFRVKAPQGEQVFGLSRGFGAKQRARSKLSHGWVGDKSAGVFLCSSTAKETELNGDNGSRVKRGSHGLGATKHHKGDKPERL